MLRLTRRLKFRALIVDDDEAVLDRLANVLRGQSVMVGGRRVEPEIDTLRVEVTPNADGGFEFSSDTLSKLLNTCRHRYELIILDYSYASKDMQTKQWREGQNARVKLESNDHLLTLVELKLALESSPESSDWRSRKRMKAFFAQETQVLLRSFQHDRKKDRLGSYDTRFSSTQGVFTSAQIHRMDSFQMIYNAEPELRSAFYDRPANGREFYRNIVTNFIVVFFNLAMYRYLAESSTKIAIPRGTLGMSLITVCVTGTGAFMSRLVAPVEQAIAERDIGTVGFFAAIAIIVTLVVSFTVSYFVDRLLRSAAKETDD